MFFLTFFWLLFFFLRGTKTFFPLQRRRILQCSPYLWWSAGAWSTRRCTTACTAVLPGSPIWHGTSTPTGQTNKVQGNFLPAVQLNLLSQGAAGGTAHHQQMAVVDKQVVIVDLLFIGLDIFQAAARVSKKKVLFHVRKKNRSQENITKNNSCHPQNWRFPLSTMVANIHLWSLFCDVNITSSQL